MRAATFSRKSSSATAKKVDVGGRAQVESQRLLGVHRILHGLLLRVSSPVAREEVLLDHEEGFNLSGRLVEGQPAVITGAFSCLRLRRHMPLHFGCLVAFISIILFLTSCAVEICFGSLYTPSRPVWVCRSSGGLL